MSSEIIAEVFVITLCLAAGGILKGATGAGAPLLAVPALAAYFDVRFAVIVMLAPNLLTNLWQAIRFRAHMPAKGFMLPMLIGGGIGVIIGTFALKNLPADVLSLVMAFAVLGYVVLRLSRPDWKLKMALAKKLALPAGIAAGVLQGSAGLSAPVSLTFLNAMRMERLSFIAAISAFFTTFTAVQLVTAATNGLIHQWELLYSAFALLPVSLAMPIGAMVAKKVSPAALDRVILVILACLAAKLLVEGLSLI